MRKRKSYEKEEHKRRVLAGLVRARSLKVVACNNDSMYELYPNGVCSKCGVRVFVNEVWMEEAKKVCVKCALNLKGEESVETSADSSRVA